MSPAATFYSRSSSLRRMSKYAYTYIVVSTITLCSIPDVTQAMSELFQVLKPGGRILFLEPGASPNAKVARWQRRLNWAHRLFADGCTLTLDVPKLLSTQPFRAVEINNFYMEETLGEGPLTVAVGLVVLRWQRKIAKTLANDSEAAFV